MVWGLLHGIMLSLEVIFSKQRKILLRYIPSSLAKYIGVLFTFSFVTFTYIYFRAESIADANTITTKILMIFDGDFYWNSLWLGIVRVEFFLLSCALIGFLMAVQIAQGYIDIEKRIARCSDITRWLVYQAGILSIIFLGVWHGENNFIYFQF